MIAAFDVVNVNPNPARFDLKKADAINGDHIRLLELADFTDRLLPYLWAADVLGQNLTADQQRVLEAVAPLVQTRMNVLSEAPGLLASFFVTNDQLEFAPDALASLTDDAGAVLSAGIASLEGVSDADWTTENIQGALNASLIEQMELKPRVAFGPLRVALSGARISPPLFESMEILGKPETLARLTRLASTL
jgi:glutamyl-tRNA synthetase